MIELPRELQLARDVSEWANLKPKVGAVFTIDKETWKGYNKQKTHPKFANPEKTERRTLHAELDCLSKLKLSPYEEQYDLSGGTMYVYREVDGLPAMARPCNHCMKFIKEYGIKKVVYTVPHEPWYEEEEI